MFRLKATLVAMTPMRPWRTGWSVDRGVDFFVAAAAMPAAVQPEAHAGTAPGEPASFIDEDWIAPTRSAVVRSFASLLAGEAGVETSTEDAPEASGVRAWWSLASKPSRT